MINRNTKAIAGHIAIDRVVTDSIMEEERDSRSVPVFAGLASAFHCEACDNSSQNYRDHYQITMRNIFNLIPKSFCLHRLLQ